METITACINCGAPVEARYCSQCGQANPPKKLNLLTLYTDFQSRIYGFDGMFPRTLRDLTLRPGQVALKYIQGNRVKYVAPVGYFFLALTMFLLSMEILGVDLYELSKANNPLNSTSTANQEKFQRYFIDLMSRYMRIFSFMLIPFATFFAWIFFRRMRFNMLEHSVLVFYVYGHVMWFSLMNLLLYKLTGYNLSIYQLLLQGGLYAFGCYGLYNYQARWKIIGKALLVGVLSFFIYIIFVAGFGVAYILLNPEMAEMLKKS